jgi:hypothetical protein
VGPRTGLDDVEKRKILPLPKLDFRPLGRPAPSQRYTDCAVYVRILFNETCLLIFRAPWQASKTRKYTTANTNAQRRTPS